MYSVGDYVVHPGQGLCQVEAVTASPDASYLLMPLGQRRPILINFPVCSEARLRRVLTRDEAQQIVDDYPQMQVDEFRARNNSLEEEHFRSEIRTGSCRDSVRIVKTFCARIEGVIARNKKPPVAYERILKCARERCYPELALALGCSVEDISGLLGVREGEDLSRN